MTGGADEVRACAFDMFGTLFDVHSVVRACRDALGEEGEAFSEDLRRTQLRYSWLRALMGRWIPFWRITRDALDVTLRRYGREDDDELRERLLATYREVDPYPDSGPALEALNEAGIRCAILTNGSRDMVSSALSAAGFEEHFEAIFSVDAIETFKPRPQVYRMATDGLELEARELAMVSSHPWDLAGAISCGFRGVWVRRPGDGHHLEALDHDPTWEVEGMDGLVRLLASG